MLEPGIQQIFFREIKATLPPHISLVDAVAEVIKISNDSAYRRIRGEKPLSFEEMKALCAHFHISLDKLFLPNSNSFVFEGHLSDKDSFGVDQFFNYLLSQVNYFNSFAQREIFFTGRDHFLFHVFNFHELTAFKIFFWMKTFYEYDSDGMNGSILETMQEKSWNMAPKMLAAFNKLPSVEIWTEDSMNILIRQIDYYRQTQAFPNEEYAMKLYSSVLEMVNHIEKQAEAGRKFAIGEKPTAESAPFRFFVNEFTVGDNCNLVVLDNTKVVFLNHSLLNIMMTKDPAFTEYTYQHFHKLMRKSTLMSNAGEKHRTRFFNTIREKIVKSMNQS